MVCAELVEFVAGFPATPPVDLSDAKVWDKDCRGGWRSLCHHQPEVEWFLLHGHPVVQYTSRSPTTRVTRSLIWKNGRDDRIKEINIGGDVLFSHVDTGHATHIPQRKMCRNSQIALF